MVEPKHEEKADVVDDRPYRDGHNAAGAISNELRKVLFPVILVSKQVFSLRVHGESGGMYALVFLAVYQHQKGGLLAEYSWW